MKAQPFIQAVGLELPWLNDPWMSVARAEKTHRRSAEFAVIVQQRYGIPEFVAAL
jgi:hypothetical protein